MKNSLAPAVGLAFGICTLMSPAEMQAGQEIHTITDTDRVVTAPLRTWLPGDGAFTLGVSASSKLTGTYLDSTTGLWAPQSRDALLFLDSRYHLEDNGQFVSSTGLGFRKLLPEREIILGANVFWDSISSEHHNDFGQPGVGLEVLSHWVDARVNYSMARDEQFEVDGHTFNRGGRQRNFSRYEAALEGVDAEVGVLIPGLEKYTEVRVFAGYYYYNNPFGGDFQGFKARLEAHLLPGVVAEVAYWGDAQLMGGHWTAGARVSVPFSIYNLATGRNPFEGIGEYFTRRTRKFNERMDDMVIRSPRIQTTTSGDIDR